MSETQREWLRRNRFGLLALPLVAALAVAANGIRLDDDWWNTGLRSSTSGTQGEFVRYQQGYTDALGRTSRTLKVRVDGIREVTEIPQEYGDPIAVPSGMKALEVGLSFEADPEQSIYGCQLALRDSRGVRYEFAATLANLRQNDPSPCHPLEQPGPKPPVFAGQDRETVPGEERPPTWTASPIVFVPPDAQITQVLMWWEKPEFLRVKASVS
ncbi:MAG: hypothetical protein ABIQ61_12715 [Ornithinibacter sp.]